MLNFQSPGAFAVVGIGQIVPGLEPDVKPGRVGKTGLEGGVRPCPDHRTSKNYLDDLHTLPWHL
jgi:hypothetical protein